MRWYKIMSFNHYGSIFRRKACSMITSETWHLYISAGWCCRYELVRLFLLITLHCDKTILAMTTSLATSGESLSRETWKLLIIV